MLMCICLAAWGWSDSKSAGWSLSDSDTRCSLWRSTEPNYSTDYSECLQNHSSFTDYSERSYLAGFTDYSERLWMHSFALPTKTSSEWGIVYSLIWSRCFSDPFRVHHQIATDYSERLHRPFTYHDPQWTSLLITVNVNPGCAALWSATDYSECLEQKEVKISAATCWACLNTC